MHASIFGIALGSAAAVLFFSVPPFIAIFVAAAMIGGIFLEKL